MFLGPNNSQSYFCFRGGVEENEAHGKNITGLEVTEDGYSVRKPVALPVLVSVMLLFYCSLNKARHTP